MDYVTHDIRPIGSTFYKDKRKYHIVSYFNDSGKNGYKMFGYVVKFWVQYWHYEAITAEDFDDYVKFGLIKEK